MYFGPHNAAKKVHTLTTTTGNMPLIVDIIIKNNTNGGSKSVIS